jgi:hypothetical protein
VAHAYQLEGLETGETLVLTHREFYNLQRLGGVGKPYVGEGTLKEDELQPMADTIEWKLPAIDVLENALLALEAHQESRDNLLIGTVPTRYGTGERPEEDDFYLFFTFNRDKLSEFISLGYQERAFAVSPLPY